ncbi:TetR/AcrR family transcriptional regulator [Massilia sp. MB5]|uniref:TetR/AcrR family transcriptional regulator n=1 Tax=Massilia sp. MB5 TaxID=2919578 RepID=UPI001F0D1BC7|nr:TetR/AcrR family transcriptional regulator [Massilia sp. MB5]UMR28995.1 TetR/AcrR family transcriptional regulator [Massilia sp. MB5]
MSETSAKQRGRPARPEEEVVAAMLSSTIWLLLNQGYAAATMEAVAKHAGLAKKTIYRHAANREELVGLVVRHMTDAFAPLLLEDVGKTDQVFPALERMLLAIARSVLSADAVGLFRLLTTEFPGRAEMLTIYQRNGIERGTEMLVEWLERQRSRKLIVIGEPRLFCELLLGMAIGEPLRRMALGLIPPMPEWDAAAHIRTALQLVQRTV